MIVLLCCCMKRFGTGTDFDNRIATQNCQTHSQYIRNTFATHSQHIRNTFATHSQHISNTSARIVKPAEYTQTQRHLVLPLTPTAQEFVRAERPELHQFFILHSSDDLASAQGHTPGRCVGERCVTQRFMAEFIDNHHVTGGFIRIQ
jgi:hypothetical protein